jgi:hypothetical protein
VVKPGKHMIDNINPLPLQVGQEQGIDTNDYPPGAISELCDELYEAWTQTGQRADVTGEGGLIVGEKVGAW